MANDAADLKADLSGLAQDFREVETRVRALPGQVPAAVRWLVADACGLVADACVDLADDCDRIESDVRSGSTIRALSEDWATWAENISESLDVIRSVRVPADDWVGSAAVEYANAVGPQETAVAFLEGHARLLSERLVSYADDVDSHVGNGVLLVASLGAILLSTYALIATGVAGPAGVASALALLISVGVASVSIVLITRIADDLRDTSRFDELVTLIDEAAALEDGQWPGGLRRNIWYVRTEGGGHHRAV